VGRRPRPRLETPCGAPRSPPARAGSALRPSRRRSASWRRGAP